MRVLSNLTRRELDSRLAEQGLAIRTGPFNVRIASRISSVADGLACLYADYPVSDPAEYVDFTVTLSRSGGFRQFLRPQVRFVHDGQQPFVPMPVDHAFPLLEWAMNWCITSQNHHCLTLHSAVIERGGLAVVLPAPPGSGKSTLCAALVSRGWRLLSDELAMVSLSDGSIQPLCRPVSLKNASIAIIQGFVPEAVMNRVTHDTTKGSVTHMKVRPEHLARVQESARPRWIVFPKYVAGARPELRPRSKADGLLELGRNSFNYQVLGLRGFETLADMVEQCDCHDFTYSRLEDAIATFDRLAEVAGVSASVT